ncbi:MAG: hypothetical protein K0R83_455 [Caulobacter sp.]|jgi:hypothetical protein|nr:hypothetical protein [Caulobacter sp.]
MPPIFYLMFPLAMAVITGMGVFISGGQWLRPILVGLAVAGVMLLLHLIGAPRWAAPGFYFVALFVYVRYEAAKRFPKRFG